MTDDTSQDSEKNRDSLKRRLELTLLRLQVIRLTMAIIKAFVTML
ncbi:hypothetical protein [Haladaptatus sp. CMAA 1911]